jgi:hypothetical protein
VAATAGALRPTTNGTASQAALASLIGLIADISSLPLFWATEQIAKHRLLLLHKRLAMTNRFTDFDYCKLRSFGSRIKFHNPIIVVIRETRLAHDFSTVSIISQMGAI